MIYFVTNCKNIIIIFNSNIIDINYFCCMKTQKFIIKFILNIFPPLFFNRIILKEISDCFLEMKVIIKRSIFNMNYYKTIFGGSIFSACDSYFPTMYYHVFSKKGREIIVWLKASEIQYLKPAESNLMLHFIITKEEILLAEKTLNEKGKFEIWHTVKAINDEGVVCTKAKMQIYLRDKKLDD